MARAFDNLLRDWFRVGQSGCHFASHLAAGLRSSTFTEVEFGDNDLDDFATVVDESAKEDRVAILLFPRITRMPDLVRMISKFSHPPRWTLAPMVHPDPTARIAGIEITFQTTHGDLSAAMGFAPCLEMPMSRRAPTTALALWGGPKSNPYFRGGPLGKVNMAHAAHQISDESIHRKRWDNTVAATKERLTLPAFDAKWLRKVSFCLPREDVDAIFAQNTPRSPSEGSA